MYNSVSALLKKEKWKRYLQTCLFSSQLYPQVFLWKCSWLQSSHLSYNHKILFIRILEVISSQEWNNLNSKSIDLNKSVWSAKWLGWDQKSASLLLFSTPSIVWPAWLGQDQRSTPSEVSALTFRCLTCTMTWSGSERSACPMLVRMPSFSASQTLNLVCSSENCCQRSKTSCSKTHWSSVHWHTAAHRDPSCSSCFSMAAHAAAKKAVHWS